MKNENKPQLNIPSNTFVLPKKQKNTRVSIYFRAEDLELLDNIAERSNTSRSQVIHEMLNYFRTWASIIAAAIEKGETEPLMIEVTKMLLEFSKYKENAKYLRELVQK